MTITFDCTDWMKERCPAVVHVDGTARPQLVDAETQSRLPPHHRSATTSCRESRCVVNTSFNMHEEPIVCTPDDAIRSYRRGKLDNLALGPFLLGDEPAP